MEPFTGSFHFSSPTRSVFGVDSVKSIGMESSSMGKRALIVTDSFLSKSKMFNSITTSLKQAGLQFIILDNVVPNPQDVHVHEGVEAYRKNGCDMLVAVGGGSSIDSAKTIGAIITNGGKTQDFLDEGSVENPLPPFIAVPTTAGTGSEVTIFAVITDSNTHEKLILFSGNLLPRAAILDPQLTVSLPPEQTAFTGLDALTHAIEAYTTAVANPVSDALACYAIEIISSSIERAYNRGDDLEARSGMLIGSHIAGIAFSNADLGSIHTMGEVLAGVCSIPHGAAMAIFLPYVMEFSLEETVDKYARIAALMGVNTAGQSKNDAARNGIEYIKELERKLSLPSLSTYDVKKSSFDDLAKNCKEHVCDTINPKKISEGEYKKLYHMAYDNAYGI
jgi:alcohol dehydrogenase